MAKIFDFFRALFGFELSIETITASAARSVAQLEKLRDRNDDAAEAARYEANRLNDEADKRVSEAERAHKLSRKYAELADA